MLLFKGVISSSLRIICKLRKLNQASLARIAGVTPQAVSHWFKASEGGEIDIKSSHLRQLAEGLHVSAEDLLQPLPLLDQVEEVSQYETQLLWDRLYPSLGDFSVALVRGEAPALARLVQVFGLYASTKIAGRKVWDRFPAYQKLIRPVRRAQLERVWQLHQNPALI